MRLSLGWLTPPVPRSSDITVIPAILQEYGVMTSPSPGPGGGGSPAVWAEREKALWPTPTAVRQQLRVSELVAGALQEVVVHSRNMGVKVHQNPPSSSLRHFLYGPEKSLLSYMYSTASAAAWFPTFAWTTEYSSIVTISGGQSYSYKVTPLRN